MFGLTIGEFIVAVILSFVAYICVFAIIDRICRCVEHGHYRDCYVTKNGEIERI